MTKRKMKAPGNTSRIDISSKDEHIEIALPLSFDMLRFVSRSRAKSWHGKHGVKDWNSLEWSAATCGEGGELAHEVIQLFLLAQVTRSLGQAANLAKKIKRIDTGLNHRKNERDRAKLVKRLANECADVVIYLDHLADREGIDLGESVRATFNKTSKKFGFAERL